MIFFKLVKVLVLIVYVGQDQFLCTDVRFVVDSRAEHAAVDFAGGRWSNNILIKIKYKLINE